VTRGLKLGPSRLHFGSKQYGSVMNGPPAVPYSHFVREVRKFRPSALIPLLAQHSARKDQLGAFRFRNDGQYPWAIAAMARESVLAGTETASPQPSESSIRRMYDLYNGSYDNDPRGSSVSAIMTPLAYEQFPYGESVFEEIARAEALLDDASLGHHFEWSEVLGIELLDALRANLVLHAWVGNNQGRFDPSILDLSHMEEVFDKVSSRESIEVLARYFTTTVEAARREYRTIPSLPKHLRKYAFNPLSVRPLVDLGDPGIWAPQTALVIRALSVPNRYHAGLQKWGQTFTRKLGEVVEAYLGRQLRLIAGEDLQPEIVFSPRGNRQSKSVDWIWTTEKCIFLFESKSARLSMAGKAGGDAIQSDTSRYLQKAREQIDETTRLIVERHPSFAHIPDDRPILGVAVMSEAFYLGNSFLIEYGSPSVTPSIVASLRDIEQLVCYPPDVAARHLSTVICDEEKRSWSLANTLTKLGSTDKNPILAEAWDRLDFETDRTSKRQDWY
jgi:hypothetical protein